MEEKYPHLKFIQALICGGTAPDDVLVELNKYNPILLLVNKS